MRIDLRIGAGTRVLVTGGAGFVGSTLVAVLLERGCSVVVIDNLSNGDLRDLPTNDQRLAFQAFTVGDPAVAARLDDAVAAVDLVMHLASPIGVKLVHRQRYAVTKNIVDAGSAVAEACRRHQRPLLFTSSSEVYGPGLERPIAETDPLVSDLRPRWGYAVAKAAVEHMVAGLFVEYGIPSWIVRPFNMAGARQKPATGLVIATFAEAALSGKPLVIHGDGSQTRAFLHVADAADALLHIVQCPELHGRPVNVGGPTATRIDELAAMVVRAAHASVAIVHEPPETIFGSGFAVTHDRIPDIGLLMSVTGWRPLRSTEQAISDCIDHLRSR